MDYKPEFDHLISNGDEKDKIAFGRSTIHAEYSQANNGLSYEGEGKLNVDVDRQVVILPGVEIRFAQMYGLYVHGRLLA